MKRLEELINKIKELGFSVIIRKRTSKTIISWSSVTTWASASYSEDSEEDMELVCNRLQETIYSVTFRKEIKG